MSLGEASKRSNPSATFRLPASQRQGKEQRHDGRVAVDQLNGRWCSDALKIGCDNGEKVRVAFALDYGDWEDMGHVATTTTEDVRDLTPAPPSSNCSPSWPTTTISTRTTP